MFFIFPLFGSHCVELSVTDPFTLLSRLYLDDFVYSDTKGGVFITLCANFVFLFMAALGNMEEVMLIFFWIGACLTFLSF